MPEIRLFAKQNCSDSRKSANGRHQALPYTTTTSSWKKSNSWSWKSKHALQTNRDAIKQKSTNMETKHIQTQVRCSH